MYLTIGLGRPADAKELVLRVLKLEPQNSIAGNLLKELESILSEFDQKGRRAGGRRVLVEETSGDEEEEKPENVTVVEANTEAAATTDATASSTPAPAAVGDTVTSENKNIASAAEAVTSTGKTQSATSDADSTPEVTVERISPAPSKPTQLFNGDSAIEQKKQGGGGADAAMPKLLAKRVYAVEPLPAALERHRATAGDAYRRGQYGEALEAYTLLEAALRAPPCESLSDRDRLVFLALTLSNQALCLSKLGEFKSSSL